MSGPAVLPLQGLVVLLLCQSVGELVARALQLPLPGPVVGMLLCLLVLGVPGVRHRVEPAAQALLQHLSLLFVPVGVGVVAHLGLLAAYGWQLALTLLVSTVCGLAVTALCLRAALPKESPPENAP